MSLLRELRNFIPPSPFSLYLFGSTLKNSIGRDIDLLVVVDKSKYDFQLLQSYVETISSIIKNFCSLKTDFLVLTSSEVDEARLFDKAIFTKIL